MKAATEIRTYIDLLTESKHEISMPEMTYGISDLDPVMSEQTVDLHLNTLTQNYIKKQSDNEFQYAGAFLHKIWWANIREPRIPNTPPKFFIDFITDHFDNLATFKKEFTESATTIQGNGWCALLKDGSIVQIPNHKTRQGIVLLLDMWEHAYIMDYGADKKKYVSNFWKIVDWDHVISNLS